MSNAWFYYLLPLLLGTVFAIAGSALFRYLARRFRGDEANRYGWRTSLLVTIGGGAFGLAIIVVTILTSPTPWERQSIFNHIFHTPPEQIERFVILAASEHEYLPLTKSEVVIDDPARIRQITDILRAAPEVSPSHPRTKWSAQVEMVTRDGTYHFGVRATVPGDSNGTLIEITSMTDGNGWHLDDARADGLEKILEDAVKSPAAR